MPPQGSHRVAGEGCQELLVSKSWLSSCVDEDAVDSMGQFLVGSFAGHWPLMSLVFREEWLVFCASLLHTFPREMGCDSHCSMLFVSLLDSSPEDGVN